jgi:hypothetical protein
LIWIKTSARKAAGSLTTAYLGIVIGPATWLGLSAVEGVKDLAASLGAGSLVVPSPPDGVKNWQASPAPACAVMILAIVQIGAAIVLVPVIIWIWIDKDFTTAVLMTVFLCIVGILDNVLKPLVMGRGLTTPTLVIFVGVIGGTLAHGIVGLFIGPIILSVAWELTVAWIRTDRTDAALPNQLSNVDLDQRSMPRGSLSELRDK